MEELVGAAVKVVGRDDLVAHLRDVQQGQRGRRLPGRNAQRARAALDRGDALLEHVGGRVHDPRVDVAELLEGEQVRRVVGVFEDVGGRLVNRHGPRAGGRVGDLAGVQRQRARALDVVLIILLSVVLSMVVWLMADHAPGVDRHDEILLPKFACYWLLLAEAVRRRKTVRAEEPRRGRNSGRRRLLQP